MVPDVSEMEFASEGKIANKKPFQASKRISRFQEEMSTMMKIIGRTGKWRYIFRQIRTFGAFALQALEAFK